MKPISKSDLQKKNKQELAALSTEFRNRAGALERERRATQATEADIRSVQGQRRIIRPNS